MTARPTASASASTCALAARRPSDAISVPTGPERNDDATAWWSDSRPLRSDDLAADMVRAIIEHSGSTTADDPLLAAVTRASIDAFLAHAGHPVAAAQSVAELLQQIGAREAVLERGFDNLASSFRVARDAVDAHLPRLLVRHPLPSASVAALHDDLGVFLERLLRHAREGFDRRWAVGEMPIDLARAALRRAVFGPTSTTHRDNLPLIARRAGLDASASWCAVVQLDGPLDLDPVAPSLPGLDRHEALIPDATPLEQLLGAAGHRGQVVLGPSTLLLEARRSVQLARRTAGLLHGGLTPADGPVLRTADVLGELVSSADPFLAELLIDKHLGPLADLPLGRRLDLAEPLLTWLESGCAVSKLARDLGFHEQTIHHRFRRIRELFPAATLHDPRQRFELIVALRNAVPGWREQGRTPAGPTPRGDR